MIKLFSIFRTKHSKNPKTVFFKLRVFIRIVITPSYLSKTAREMERDVWSSKVNVYAEGKAPPAEKLNKRLKFSFFHSF